MASRLPQRTSWHDEGFAAPPVERPAAGGEVIYRAYGGTSAVVGNCFFAPAVNATPIGHWSAELLEVELNAALWGNDFEGVTEFEMIRGALYRIGPIAHDGYAGLDGGQVFHQRAFITPSGIFKQIRFVLPGTQRLTDCVKQKGSFTISAGRYAREASARARRYRQ